MRGGRLVLVVDFFAAILVLFFGFLAARWALLTAFLTGEVEARVRFFSLFFAAVDVFVAADFVLGVVLGAERFAFLAAVLTVDAVRLTVFLIGLFAVLPVFFAAALVLLAFWVAAPLGPAVVFLMDERRVLVVFLTAALVFRADRWAPDFFWTVFLLLAGFFFIGYHLNRKCKRLHRASNSNHLRTAFL